MSNKNVKLDQVASHATYIFLKIHIQIKKIFFFALGKSLLSAIQALLKKCLYEPFFNMPARVTFKHNCVFSI